MVPFSLGILGYFMLIQIYVIDSYPVYTAFGITVLTAMRSLVGAFLPLTGPPLYSSLGLGWGNSLLGFVAFVYVPIPIFFSRWGQRLREKYPLEL